MPLANSLSSQVTPTIRDRGLALFRAGVVTIESASPTAIAAMVGLTDVEEVDLTLSGRTLRAACTCETPGEYISGCKHIWATILAADHEAKARRFVARAGLIHPLRFVIEEKEDDFYDDEEYYDYPRPILPPHRSLPPPPKPIRESWKDQLAALSREVQPTVPSGRQQSKASVDRQLVFVVDVQASQGAKKLVLEVNVQERKLNGEWGKPRVKYLSDSEMAGLVDPLDRQLLALFSGAERGETYGYGSSYYGSGTSRYRLTGTILDTVLPLLAQTGRIFLRRELKPPVLENVKPDLDPPWELAVSVTRSPNGKSWVLAGGLRRGEETIPLAAPVLLIPGLVFWDGRVARLNDDGAFAWVPILRRVGTITVPISGGNELLAHLLQMPRLPRLALPDELSYTEEAVAPRPRLVVKAAKQRYGSQMLIAKLSFNYDGQIVPDRPPGRGIFQSDTKRFLVRDLGAEQAALQLLTRRGLRYGWSGGEENLELKPAQLPKLVRELIAAGWQIEAEGKLYRQAGVFNISVRTARDWFDLDATADFEGRPVPLPRLLEALRRGESTIVLDDGSLGMVPEDWLKKYGLFAKMGTIEGDSVRFGKGQIGVLDALLASRPEVTFDTQFARARDELRKFEGVAPAEAPPGFVGELRGYQQEGLGWLRFLRSFGFGGCLADDMGLGKTVQVLAMLAGRRAGPALVVVPRSLIFNWKQEAARFTPSLKVLDHTGIGRDRTGASFKNYDLILTTYGTLRNDAATFADFRFDTCVLDESQAAKNADTETAKAVRLVQADHRLALSGTPVENHLGELWTLFDFLNPGMLGRATVLGGATGAGRNLDPETREILAKALRPYILRRTKDQVAKDLPAKTEQTVYCDLEPTQRKLYDELRDHYRQSLLPKIDAIGMGRNKIQVLEALLRLRQAACHPGLIDKARTTETSAKLDILLPQLKELAEGGSKALVFSQFTSLLAIVRSRLDADGVTYEYLDGRTRDRQARVERFQTDPACKLFLVSLKAGGVGLNLTAAEYVFLLDPWWNPAVEAQAIDRSHRIGQTKPVFAYRLIARGTVEEKVLALQQSKRELADAILGGDGSLITDLKREDLELLLS
jgi:superfamily II DNA or RNA helicase